MHMMSGLIAINDGVSRVAIARPPADRLVLCMCPGHL